MVKEINHYFQTNITPDSDTGVVWEAHKAVIRGVLIRHGARLKKARTKQLDALLVRLQTLEASHKATPTGSLGGSWIQFARRSLTYCSIVPRQRSRFAGERRMNQVISVANFWPTHCEHNARPPLYHTFSPPHARSDPCPNRSHGNSIPFTAPCIIYQRPRRRRRT